MIKNYNSDKQQHDKRNKDEDLGNWGNPLKSNLDDSSVIKGLRIKKQKRKKMKTTIEEFYQMQNNELGSFDNMYNQSDDEDYYEQDNSESSHSNISDEDLATPNDVNNSNLVEEYRDLVVDMNRQDNVKYDD